MSNKKQLQISTNITKKELLEGRFMYNIRFAQQKLGSSLILELDTLITMFRLLADIKTCTKIEFVCYLNELLGLMKKLDETRVTGSRMKLAKHIKFNTLMKIHDILTRHIQLQHIETNKPIMQNLMNSSKEINKDLCSYTINNNNVIECLAIGKNNMPTSIRPAFQTFLAQFQSGISWLPYNELKMLINNLYGIIDLGGKELTNTKPTLSDLVFEAINFYCNRLVLMNNLITRQEAYCKNNDRLVSININCNKTNNTTGSREYVYTVRVIAQIISDIVQELKKEIINSSPECIRDKACESIPKDLDVFNNWIHEKIENQDDSQELERVFTRVQQNKFVKKKLEITNSSQEEELSTIEEAKLNLACIKYFMELAKSKIPNNTLNEFKNKSKKITAQCETVQTRVTNYNYAELGSLKTICLELETIYNYAIQIDQYLLYQKNIVEDGNIIDINTACYNFIQRVKNYLPTTSFMTQCEIHYRNKLVTEMSEFFQRSENDVHELFSPNVRPDWITKKFTIFNRYERELYDKFTKFISRINTEDGKQYKTILHTITTDYQSTLESLNEGIAVPLLKNVGQINLDSIMSIFEEEISEIKSQQISQELALIETLGTENTSLRVNNEQMLDTNDYLHTHMMYLININATFDRFANIFNLLDHESNDSYFIDFLDIVRKSLHNMRLINSHAYDNESMFNVFLSLLQQFDRYNQLNINLSDLLRFKSGLNSELISLPSSGERYLSRLITKVSLGKAIMFTSINKNDRDINNTQTSLPDLIIDFNKIIEKSINTTCRRSINREFVPVDIFEVLFEKISNARLPPLASDDKLSISFRFFQLLQLTEVIKWFLDKNNIYNTIPNSLRIFAGALINQYGGIVRKLPSINDLAFFDITLIPTDFNKRSSPIIREKLRFMQECEFIGDYINFHWLNVKIRGAYAHNNLTVFDSLSTRNLLQVNNINLEPTQLLSFGSLERLLGYEQLAQHFYHYFTNTKICEFSPNVTSHSLFSFWRNINLNDENQVPNSKEITPMNSNQK